MKKSAVVLALLATFCALCSFTAYAQESDFTVKDGMIASYNGTDSYVEIPLIIDGVEIAGIDSYAFNNNDTVETVVIGEGIEVIQSYAFVDCDRLTTVKCPDSMLLIGFDAFDKCYALEDLDVPESTHLMIDYSSMPGSTYSTPDDPTETVTEETEEYSLTNSTITKYNGTGGDVVIPSEINGVTITAIGASAFKGNTTITSVVIPDTITEIGNSAFKGCTALSSVKLPSRLSKTGSSVFRECKLLETVTIPGSLNTIGSYMFYDCSGLNSVILEEGVTDTGAYTFCNCAALATITVPSTLTTVGTWAMGYCKKLKEFYLPEGVKSLGDASFYYCNVINNINMPDTVTYMGTHCFRGCWALKNIRLSESLTAITYRAFHNCAFTEINIPAGVTAIGIEPFWYCQKLTSINIPANVKSIGNQAFYNCTALKSVVMYDKVTTIGTNIFGKPNGSLNNNITIYAPENSYAGQYAENNKIEHKPIVALEAPVVGSDSIGTYGTINYPFASKISSFGTRYLPESLYNEGSDDVLDISYDGNTNVTNGNTYMTLMTEVPPEAMGWRYVATPYIRLTDGTTVTGDTRSFNIATMIINGEGGTVTNVD